MRLLRRRTRPTGSAVAVNSRFLRYASSASSSPSAALAGLGPPQAGPRQPKCGRTAVDRAGRTLGYPWTE
jgi:hypothetical protein